VQLSIYVRSTSEMLLYDTQKCLRPLSHTDALFDIKLNSDYDAASVKKVFHALIEVENLYSVNKVQDS
jgi:hypothetical protein